MKSNSGSVIRFHSISAHLSVCSEFRNESELLESPRNTVVAQYKKTKQNQSFILHRLSIFCGVGHYTVSHCTLYTIQHCSTWLFRICSFRCGLVICNLKFHSNALRCGANLFAPSMTIECASSFGLLQIVLIS